MPYGTRLINRDVPQEVVRVLFDHFSGEITAHYARLHDTTVRRHWENARKVNACLTCPMFVTTPEFPPQHREHRQQVLQIITAAEARGQQRLAEMNHQVLGNLDNIITALEADTDGNEAANAS